MLDDDYGPPRPSDAKEREPRVKIEPKDDEDAPDRLNPTEKEERHRHKRRSRTKEDGSEGEEEDGKAARKKEHKKKKKRSHSSDEESGPAVPETLSSSPPPNSGAALEPAPAAAQPMDEDQDDEAGPAIPNVLVQKPKKVLPNEKILLSKLPSATRYERSYMHRDHVTHLAVSKTDFLITASRDGVVQFWKKQLGGIEFAKKYKAHLGPIIGLSISKSGFLGATVSADQTLKFYNVLDFDMIHMIRLGFTPTCCCFIHSSKSDIGLIAVGRSDTNEIYVFKSIGPGDPVAIVNVHSPPV